jgi:uncharacterized protein
MITTRLLLLIKEQFKIDFWGLHGVIHWNNVALNAWLLAQQGGVNLRVLEYFSIFHDSGRENDGSDCDHGKRAAALASAYRDHIFLNDDEFLLLQTACALHTSAVTHHEITVQCCFSSDRLDLGRVGKYPDSAFLCPMAQQKEIIEQCYQRSLAPHDLPDAPFGLTDFWDVFKHDRYTESAIGTKK